MKLSLIKLFLSLSLNLLELFKVDFYRNKYMQEHVQNKHRLSYKKTLENII